MCREVWSASCSPTPQESPWPRTAPASSSSPASDDDADTIAVADVLRQETVGGALMLVAAVVALLWANLGPDSYQAVLHLPLGPLDLEHWTADGLLAIFFFVAGLELKRELTVGALSRPAEALVPDRRGAVRHGRPRR